MLVDPQIHIFGRNLDLLLHMKLLFFGRITALIIFLSCISAAPQHINNDKFKKEVLTSINLVRQKGCNCGHIHMPPVAPVTWNDKLEDAARWHALDMSERKYFSHTSRNGRGMAARVISAGYDSKGYKSFTVGENIAQGQTSVAEVMKGWLKSEGHCRNIMNPGFKEVGVSQMDNYWVQDFGGRQPFSQKEQRMIKSGRYRVLPDSPVTEH